MTPVMFFTVMGALLAQFFNIGPVLIQGSSNSDTISQGTDFAHSLILGDLEEFLKNPNWKTQKCYSEQTQQYDVFVRTFSIQINNVAAEIAKKFKGIYKRYAIGAKNSLRGIANRMRPYPHNMRIHVKGSGFENAVKLMRETKANIVDDDAKFFRYLSFLRQTFFQEALLIEGKYKGIREDSKTVTSKIMRDIQMCIKSRGNE